MTAQAALCPTPCILGILEVNCTAPPQRTSAGRGKADKLAYRVTPTGPVFRKSPSIQFGLPAPANDSACSPPCRLLCALASSGAPHQPKPPSGVHSPKGLAGVRRPRHPATTPHPARGDKGGVRGDSGGVCTAHQPPAALHGTLAQPTGLCFKVKGGGEPFLALHSLLSKASA